MASDNVDRLIRARLIKRGVQFSEREKRLLESLSEEEVNALISVKKKVGKAFLSKYTHGRSPAVGIVF